MSSNSPRDHKLLLAFVLSGAAALGYELLWTRLLSLALGSELLGVMGVLAGFFGGLALGSWLLHDAAVRSPNPARLFAKLEVLAAAFALVSPHLLYALADWLPGVLGPIAGNNDTSAALGITVAIAGIALLPGTICMGGTLPALVEARRRMHPTDLEARGLGRLYAANTFGATLGTLGTVHFIVPWFGIGYGAVVLALLGLGAAWMTWRIDGLPTTHAPDVAPVIDTSKDPDPDVIDEPRVLYALVFATGLIGVGLEVVGTQILAQSLENTVYTFADVLAVYLVGTAIGAWLHQSFAAQATQGRPATVTAVMLLVTALSVVPAAAVLNIAPDLLSSVTDASTTYARHILTEIGVAVLVFALPTLCMGALFSHVVGLLARRGVGKAYALNTLGSALAPFVFGIYALPRLGFSETFYVVAWAYLGVFALFTWFRRFRPLWLVAGSIGIIGATSLGPKDLVRSDSDAQWNMIWQKQTLMGVVSVSERKPDAEAPNHAPTEAPLRRLQVGKYFRMGGAMAFGERRMGHIPLLLHPHPRTALVLGVGTGATLGAVRNFPLEHVDAVELVPAVLETLEFFDGINQEVRNDPNVTLHAADARRFVAASRNRYDVIIADLFHPARDGAGALYAREHFAEVAEHLAVDGLFAQWLPLYQLDRATFATIVRTFVDVFPEAYSFLGIYNAQTPALVLIGRVPSERGRALSIDFDALARALERPVYQALLMNDPRDFLAAFMLDRHALVEFAGEGPLNTDLDPRVVFDAPRSAYENRSELEWETLAALLPVRTPLPAGLVAAHDPRLQRQLREDVPRFAAALGHYLFGEIERVKARKADDFPDAAVVHYLAAYATAPEFAASRGMLYVAARSPRLAETILPKMLEATPNEARVWQTWLSHLQRTGDEARFQAALVEAQRRVQPPSPGEASPGEASPSEASPGEANPGEASPGEASPGEASPGEANPGEQP